MGDFSRHSDDPRRHYSSVLMQQGRVLLDSDWNEESAIERRRTETEARDVIGLCGVPKGSDAFKLAPTPDNTDLSIAPGRIYVEGLLCESESALVPVSLVLNSSNKLSVATLFADGRRWQKDEWVEISAANKPDKKLFRITAVDPSANVLTFDGPVNDFQNAGASSIRRAATYLTQLDYPNPEFGAAFNSPPQSPPGDATRQLSLQDGLYLAYVDAWQREITALDDPHIREVALGGPDTTTRLKNVCQVRLLRVTLPSPPSSPPQKGSDLLTCEMEFAEWRQLTTPGSGTLNARTKAPDAQLDPCLLPPTAGFTRLENQLYRVEVHKGGARGAATFKWSRDNATVRTKIEKIDGNLVTVSDLGKDEVLGFAAGQWVEIVDEESALKSAPRQLAQIDKIDPATREITLKSSAAAAAKDKQNLQLVRWDQTGNTAQADGVQTQTGWLDLEGGVEVEFSEGQYRAGDYWLVPARTATGDIEWPPFETPNLMPLPQPPLGIKHRFCRLALVEAKGGALNIRDCRHKFPPLTEICAEDVCYDNSACQLPGVETVQDALDRLCAARDLRWHNKHLHGWGIVCGLQVECGPDPVGQTRRHVTVRSGYALDCEGNDIVLEKPRTLDLLQLIAQANLGGATSPPASPPSASFFATRFSPPASPPGGNIPDGEVCLTIEMGQDGRPAFRVERDDPSRNTAQGLFAGTLLMDFYEGCVKSLVD
ncbi:MAG: DUF6519 domain-containing protein, partial [Pyrinomonadaceae bacterium]